jgi:hypothetical protein
MDRREVISDTPVGSVLDLKVGFGIRLEPAPELAMSYCPSCSTRLKSRSCKLVCPGCGYYMSCSDFY